MKFFLVILLVASCQAFSIESAIEKEGCFMVISGLPILIQKNTFEYVVNEATAHLEKIALEEFENAILGGEKEMSATERQLINKFATYFGSVLRDEVHEILDSVMDATHAKTSFAKRMYENLRQAALNITEGLHMAPKAATKFLHDMMADIQAMEKSGTFLLDIEDMFKNVMDKVTSIVSYQLVERRDLGDIWSKLNDTLLSIIGKIHGKFHDLHDFLKSIVKTAGDKLKPHVENVKTLAKDFISHVNQVSAKVAQQALEFFKPFASQLGDTWVRLVQKVHDRLQHITDAVNATPLY